MLIAVIRESECIGCTKCIQACPVDAILGADKLMHTVITDECIGCKLCLPPCPVDCIDLISLPQSAPKNKDLRIARFSARKKRLAAESQETTPSTNINSPVERKRYLQEALLRAKTKKQQTK